MAKIGLDAGHYVGDGRVDKAYVSVLGTRDEYTLNLRVYKVVERILVASGYTVIDIGRQEQSVTARAYYASQKGCDIVVSIHHNAGGGRGATLYRHKNGVLGSQSKRLQEALYSYIVNVNKGNRSTPINTAELGVINCNTTKCPAVLIECAFMDNNVDVALINSSGYYERMGKAIASGINDYTGVKNSDTTDKITIPITKEYNPSAYAKVKGLTKSDPYLNVRMGPSIGYKVVRQLANGNEVDVIALYSNGWAKINIVGTIGYVSADYLSISSSNNNSTNKVQVSGCSVLNIRKGPNSKEIVCQVKSGTMLIMVGSGKDSDGDTWTKVQIGDVIGYVWPKYIK